MIFIKKNVLRQICVLCEKPVHAKQIYILTGFTQKVATEIGNFWKEVFFVTAAVHS